jgi:hypothetical protein
VPVGAGTVGPGIFKPAAAGAGGGALSLIQSSVLAAPATSFTFSAIPGTFNHLLVKLVGRCAKAAEDDNVFLQFNGDTATHYSRQVSNSSAASATAESAITLSSLATFGVGVGVLPAASAVANTAGIAEWEILGYALTTFLKSVRWSAGFQAQDSGNSSVLEAGVGTWGSTAAINQIVIGTASGSGFVTGTAAYLYGVK